MKRFVINTTKRLPMMALLTAVQPPINKKRRDGEFGLDVDIIITRTG
jgi:hypothetical protein